MNSFIDSMHLIIPMACQGILFKKEGYIDPKPLINIENKNGRYIYVI